MSLFTKNCPNCGETASASENICPCGHIFDSDTDSIEAIEQYSQEEEVYEAYLAARLEQARLAAEKAIELLAADPMDKDRVTEADKANRELEAINMEYEAQLGALENAQTEAEKAKVLAQTERARLDAEAESRARKLDLEKQKTRKLAARRAEMVAKKAQVSRSFAPPKMISLSSPAVSEALAKERPTPAPSVTQPRAITRARSGQMRHDANEAIRARRAAKQLIAQRAQALAARRSHTGMPTKLQEHTSERAEQIVQATRRTSANISGNLVAAIEALDSKISHLGGQPSNLSGLTTECPNCTAPLAKTASRCSCGYSVSTGSETMPGLSLDAEDLSDLF